MDATIIKLTPRQGEVGAVSFEEAFGEHSELFGKGRARRQKRQMKRLTDKRARKKLKQEIRNDQQEARQGRKDKRHSRKKQRTDDDAVDNSVVEEAPVDETVTDQTSAEDQNTDDQSSQDDQSQDDQGGSEGEEAGSFDGEMMASAEGSAKIHPAIKHATERMAYHTEAIRRRKQHRNKVYNHSKALSSTGEGRVRNRELLSANNKQLQSHDIEIQKHEEKLKGHQEGLKKFGNHPHIAEGHRQAQANLQKHVEGRKEAENKAKVKETLVSTNLKPTIGNNRIEVAGSTGTKTVEMSSFDGAVIKSGMSTQTKWLIAIAAFGVAVVVAKKYKLI